MPELAYRYEDVRYAGPEDNPHGGSFAVELRTYPVLRHTPQGYWVDLYGIERYVRAGAKKRFACLTTLDALTSFQARKKRQRSILQAHLRDVEDAIYLAGQLLKQRAAQA